MKSMRNVKGAAAAVVALALAACCAGVAVAEQASQQAVETGTNAFATQHAALVDDEGNLPDCTSCHDMEEVAASTADWNGNTSMNPHNAHVPLDCTYCHTMEGESQTMFCATCHSMALPDGWVGRARIAGQSQK